MTKYEYQAEIFIMISDFYPENQQNSAFKYVQKLWDADLKKLKRHYDEWKKIIK